MGHRGTEVIDELSRAAESGGGTPAGQFVGALVSQDAVVREGDFSAGMNEGSGGRIDELAPTAECARGRIARADGEQAHIRQGVSLSIDGFALPVDARAKGVEVQSQAGSTDGKVTRDRGISAVGDPNDASLDCRSSDRACPLAADLKDGRFRVVSIRNPHGVWMAGAVHTEMQGADFGSDRRTVIGIERAASENVGGISAGHCLDDRPVVLEHTVDAIQVDFTLVLEIECPIVLKRRRSRDDQIVVPAGHLVIECAVVDESARAVDGHPDRSVVVGGSFVDDVVSIEGEGSGLQAEDAGGAIFEWRGAGDRDLGVGARSCGQHHRPPIYHGGVEFENPIVEVEGASCGMSDFVGSVEGHGVIAGGAAIIQSDDAVIG